MGVLGRVGAFILLGLLSCICAQAEDVVNDLSAVQFMNHYKGPDQGKELLKQNGFVVVQQFYHRIFAPYADMEMPHYVTTDSVYHTFHVIFEDLLKQVEAENSEQVLQLTRRMREALKTVTPGNLADPDAAVLADLYFQVAECLFLDTAPPADTPDAVLKELALIQAAQGIAESPLFGYKTDYSQCKPRGFYMSSRTLERYFRVMSWYGNMAFRTIDRRESLAALRIAQALNGNEELKNALAKIDGLYAYLLSSSDDLTPLDYANLLPVLSESKTAEEAWAAFGPAAASMRKPAINSMVLEAKDIPVWRERTQGMRFFGKHYLPDSDAFMNLTDTEVPGREFPSGLDVMAVNGSARAGELLKLKPDTQQPKYEQGFQKSVQVFDKFKNTAPPTHYGQFLKLVGTLTAPACPEAPAFAKTAAYTDKNLMTALTAWASMRHAWVLHAKQSFPPPMGGLGKPIMGYVEPNLAFFEAMHELLANTGEAFAAFKNVDHDRLARCDQMVHVLTDMVKKELAGTALSEGDADYLLRYGLTIARLQGFEMGISLHDASPWMALISDVHTGNKGRECLEAAVGGAMPIFVIVDRDGKQELMVGGVSSYYEFIQPVGDRLTDAAWRDRWDTGNVPPLPEWTASFVPGQFDVETIIDQIKAGEIPQEAYFVKDPAFDDFLEKAVQRDSELYNDEIYPRLIRLAAAKLGRKLVPFLLEEFQTGRVGQPGHVQYHSCMAFQQVVALDDLPALRELILGDDQGRAAAAANCLYGLPPDVFAEFLLSVYADASGPKLRSTCLRMIGEKASIDVTPKLLALWEQADPAARLELAMALGNVWVHRYPGAVGGRAAKSFKDIMRRNVYYNPTAENGPPPVRSSEEQQTAWEKDVKRIMRETVEQPKSIYPRDDGDTRSKMLDIAARMGFDEFIPSMVRDIRDAKAVETVYSLADMGTTQSEAALVELARTERSGVLCDLLRRLSETNKDEAVACLRKALLDAPDIFRENSCLMGLAFNLLPSTYPEGPGKPDVETTRAAASKAKAEEWKAYLDSLAEADKVTVSTGAPEQEVK